MSWPSSSADGASATGCCRPAGWSAGRSYLEVVGGRSWAARAGARDTGEMGAGHVRLGRSAGLALGVVGVVAYAWWATGLRPFTRPVLAATVSAGLVVIAVGASRRLPAPADRRTGRAAVWGALLAVLAAWEVASFLQHPRADHPTLSSLLDSVLADHPARALAFLVWLSVGVDLSRR